MGVRKELAVWGLLMLAAGMCLPAPAQEARVQDISIEIATKFLTAYRDNSWVPVDIVVRNTKKDLTGHLTVELSSGGRTQAPLYRVPVDSPRGSTKRFRVYCFFDRSEKISAMLYDGGRAAIPRSFDVLLPPPSLPEDFLYLVLDMNPDEGYAFLHRAMEFQGEHIRALRESLRPSELDGLPDYSQCYEPFDAVMMGDLDPTRISVEHRELLLRFVQRGGTLIINTGANAPKLRGTWLEEAAGTDFVTDITVKEAELAGSVFGPEAAAEARPDWECVFTELRPRGPDTQRLGGEKILATRRLLGQGQIITLAVDVDSKTLQGVSDYIKFWAAICTRKQTVAEPFFREAAWTFTAMIPQTAGIRVHPRSSVVTYLLVYFGVAIVANWIVWSILKRREMAWVCLVFFSIGFTLYAMIVGTAGRAKASELREIQVLQIPPEGGPARLQTVTGVLTARTLRFSMDVQQENMLVCDLRALPPGTMYGYGYGYPAPVQSGSAGRRPFEFTQGPHGRIDDFVVGASETRAFEGETIVQVPGGFKGELVLDQSGLRGTLKNETGLTLESPCLLIDGAIIPLQTGTTKEFEIDVDSSKLARKADPGDIPASFPSLPEARTAIDPYTGRSTSFVTPLLTGTQSGGAVSWALGPCVLGWAKGEISSSVTSERTFQKQSTDRFVLADVRVRRMDDAAERWVRLNANTQSQQGFMTEPQHIDMSGRSVVTVFLPPSVPMTTVEELHVELYSDDTGGATMGVLKPADDSSITLTQLSSDRTDFMGRRMFKNVYAISGWQKDLAKSYVAAGAMYADPRFGYPLYVKVAIGPTTSSTEELTPQQRRELEVQRLSEMSNAYRGVYLIGRAKLRAQDPREGGGIPWL